ncbi:damage-inducible protein DinB [SAR92 clade bacterium H231]|nr:damage-inducible protein DinB [SAR92 clade bacterium H231]
MSSIDMIKMLTEYKAWANEGLFSKLMSSPEIENVEDIKSIIGTLNHAHVVDCIFKAHLKGVAHSYTATNTTSFPALGELYESVKIVDQWYIDYANNITEPELSDNVRFQFTNGEEGCMSKSEIIFHVVNHGTYHRGNVGVLMHQNAIAPEKDVVTNFLG